MRILRFGVYLSRSGAIKVQKRRMILLIDGQNAMLPEDGEQAELPGTSAEKSKTDPVPLFRPAESFKKNTPQMQMFF